MSVHDFFSAGAVDLKGLSKYFDGLDNETRIKEARELTGKEQARLFDAAEGFKPVSLNDFVPKDYPAMKQVIHFGRNSMPMFTIFEKRFCRPDGKEGADRLWGYNQSGAIINTFVGPGYFVAKQDSAKEVVIDYWEVPPRKPEGWPEILPNTARLSRVVFYHMKDYMRGVSTHVSIGRAKRGDKITNNWFVLCRDGNI